MNNVVASPEISDTPWRSSLFWWVMGWLLLAILGLTMVKDLYLSGHQPNPVFYLTVPFVSILGAALGGYVAARLLRQGVGLIDVLAIAMITAILGQVFENASKLVWYGVWEYPGWLYLLGVLLLGLLVPATCLVRWLRLRWHLALAVALVMFLSELVLALAFSTLTGIDTPGS
jgi:hypothetical protein